LSACCIFACYHIDSDEYVPSPVRRSGQKRRFGDISESDESDARYRRVTSKKKKRASAKKQKAKQEPKTENTEQETKEEAKQDTSTDGVIQAQPKTESTEEKQIQDQPPEEFTPEQIAQRESVSIVVSLARTGLRVQRIITSSESDVRNFCLLFVI